MSVLDKATPNEPQASQLGDVVSVDPQSPVPQGRKAALSFIFVTLMLDVLGFGLLIPVAPRLVEQLDGKGESHGASMYGLLTATYAAMLFLFAPTLGSLSDKIGRRPVILIALLGSGLDYFVMAFAPSLTWLFITRAINGLSGASMSASMAYIADVTPPEKRAAGYGMVGAAFGIGFVIGPLLGGVLGEHNIRLPFIVAGCLMIVSWLYGAFVLPESLPADRRREFSIARANPVGALLSIAKFPAVLGLATALFLLNVAQFGLHATWVVYTKHRYEWSPRQVGISLAIVGIGAAIVQGGLARVLIPRIGEKRAIIFGWIVGIFAFVGYGSATQGWMIYAIIAVASIGAIAGPAAQAMMSRLVRPDQQGELQGSLASSQSVAQIFGPLLATWLFAHFIHDKSHLYIPGAPFYSSAVLSLISLFVVIAALRHAKLNSAN
ncbi:MAG: TCR/Tet family MFS transporter [Phycisphaerales bacterium]